MKRLLKRRYLQRSDFWYKLIIISLLVSLLFTLCSCMTPHPRSFTSTIPNEIRTKTRSVAVVPSTSIPTNKFIAFGKGGADGAAKGALGAIKPYVPSDYVNLMRTNPVALLIAFPLAAAAGAIEGAVKAVPLDDVQKVQATINRAIAELNVQDNLAGQLVLTGSKLTTYQFSLIRSEVDNEKGGAPTIRSLSGQHADIVIDLNVKSLGFLGGKGADPAIHFFMNVAIRAIRTADGAEIYSDNLSHISVPHKVSEWIRNDVDLFRQELEKAYADLADQVLENIFFVQEVHLDTLWSGEEHCMLKPYNPPFCGIDFISHKVSFSDVDSLQPTFQWEAFPRDKDRKSDAVGMLTRVSETTYDLKIWRGHNGYPEELIYQRLGMSAPERVIQTISPTGIERRVRIAEHAIEMTLEPSAEYYWSVRARFNLDGQTRITRWSYSRIPWSPGIPDPCLSQGGIPITRYFRFKTPKE